MPQTTYQQQQQQQQHAGKHNNQHNDELMFDPFAPPAHLTLDLAPVENLFGDSSSEHASDQADEMMYFSGLPSTVAEIPQPPPPFSIALLAANIAPTNMYAASNDSTPVPKVKKSRKAVEAGIMKQRLQEYQDQSQQLQQSIVVDMPLTAPPPPPAHTGTTTVLTEDDDYNVTGDEDDDDASDGSSEDVKPRARRATKSAAARMDDDSSNDDVAANKLKRKAMAGGVGVPPQRTQLTKAELELGATLELSRDELLNMTSEALEEHAKRLASQRSLTPDEQKRFKRQRRLIKNRESAQLSRMRKKAYVDELERQIADLKEEKDVIRRRADSSERQLTQVRAEMAQLRALLAQHPAMASIGGGVATPIAAMPEVPVAVDMMETSKRRRGAGGVTLM